MQEYIRKLLYKDLSKTTTEKVYRLNEKDGNFEFSNEIKTFLKRRYSGIEYTV